MDAFSLAGFAVNLGVTAGAVLVVLLATLAVALARGKHSVIDVAWGPGFAVIALVTYGLSIGDGDDLRRALVTALTVIWGLRLGGYIGRRNWGKPEDPRYADMLAKAPGGRTAYALRTVYLPQAVVMWFVSLPVQAAQYETAGPGPLFWIGVAVWLVGMGFESVGDWQLSRFLADPANRGRVMDRGLWRYTRHPNYFGDACVWWGLYLLATGHWIGATTIVCPALMTYLLVAKTGKELLESRLRSSRPGYAEYVRSTSGFVPLPPKRR